MVYKFRYNFICPTNALTTSVLRGGVASDMSGLFQSLSYSFLVNPSLCKTNALIDLFHKHMLKFNYRYLLYQLSDVNFVAWILFCRMNSIMGFNVTALSALQHYNRQLNKLQLQYELYLLHPCYYNN